jgi:hypothetical protein
MFARPAEPDRLLIGWQGSSSHIGDLLIVDKAIQNIAADSPDVFFEFRGCDPPPSLRLLKNVQHKMWVPVAEYSTRMPMWKWAIALAPVTDHEFNSSKSSIKMVEAGYCSIPCIASWVTPYVEFCDKDEDLKWLLCAGPSAWEPKMRALINEPVMRQFYGDKMRKVVTDHYSFNREHPGWKEALQLARAA